MSKITVWGYLVDGSSSSLGDLYINLKSACQVYYLSLEIFTLFFRCLETCLKHILFVAFIFLFTPNQLKFYSTVNLQVLLLFRLKVLLYKLKVFLLMFQPSMLVSLCLLLLMMMSLVMYKKVQTLKTLSQFTTPKHEQNIGQIILQFYSIVNIVN